MLRNVVYLLSQRSAITVRASHTWWQTAHTRLWRSRPPVLREDRKQKHSHALRLFLESWEEGMAARPRRLLRRRGSRSQNGQAGPLKKLPRRSPPQRRKNQAKRGLLFKKGKRHNASSWVYCFLSPVGKSTSCKYRGAVFHSSSWLGIFNYCWGTVNFFKQTNHSKQITLEQGVMFYVIQRMKYYVYLYVHVCEGESLSVCVCVGGIDTGMWTRI